MSVKKRLKYDSITSEFSSGWYNTLALAAETNVDLKSYEFEIQNLLKKIPKISNSVKSFKIIFHAIVDDIQMLSPSNNAQIDFDPTEILKDINLHFRDANIVFNPSLKDNKGNVLPIPGLNIINGASIYSHRDTLSSSTNSYTHRYSKDFIAPTKNIRTTESKETAKLEGVLLDYIYANLQWDPTKFINVFLVTHLNSKQGNLLYMSSNPYIADMTNTNHFNITLPFWTLGNVWKSKTENGYGYMYPKDHAALKEINKIIPENLYTNLVIEGKSRVLAKALGEMLGLSPITVFAQNLSFDNCESSPCVWTDYGNYVSCGDCDDTTANAKYPFSYNKNEIFTSEDYLCEDLATSVVGNSEDNIMSDFYFNLFSSKLYFSNNQIKRMHANCFLNYIDTKTNLITQGVLSNLVSSSSSREENESINPCENEENIGSIVDNTSTVSDKRSFRLPKKLLYNINTELNMPELDKFKILKNRIHNIINLDK